VTTERLPELEREKLKAAGSATVRVKEVVLVSPPPAAVTVTVELPAGVVALVVNVKTVEQVGLHEVEESDALAPVGRPEMLKETA